MRLATRIRLLERRVVPAAACRACGDRGRVAVSIGPLGGGTPPPPVGCRACGRVAWSIRILVDPERGAAPCA